VYLGGGQYLTFPRQLSAHKLNTLVEKKKSNLENKQNYLSEEEIISSWKQKQSLKAVFPLCTEKAALLYTTYH